MAEGTEDLSINMDAAVADISSSLAGDLGSGQDGGVSSPPVDGGTGVASPPAAPAAPPAAPTVRTVPASWAADMHPFWEKLDPKVQEYWEKREADMAKGVEPLKAEAAFAKTMRTAIQPYQKLLEAQRVAPEQAIQYLMNGHLRLSHSDKGQRMAFARELLKTYQIDEKEFGALLSGEAPVVDPTLQPVLERLTKVEGMLTQSQQQHLNAIRASAMDEVETFASEKAADGSPAHPYFEDVADDIVLLLQNPKMTLAEAYERAVYANPVTRAKELARLKQQSEAELRKKAEEEALKAAKAKGTQLRGADVRTPTEPLGSIEDTLTKTMQDIKSRAA